MPKKLNREDKLYILANACIKYDQHPNKTSYYAFIQKICTTQWGLSSSQVRDYVKTLTVAWRCDRWKGLLKEETNDSYVEETSSGETASYEATRIESKSEVIAAKTLDVLKSIDKTEPVHTVESKLTSEQDRLTDKQISQILYRKALSDTFNGVGRILLCDARDITDNRKMRIEEVLELWRRFYPVIEAEVKSNVVMIYWDGKDSGKYKLKPIIQPIAPEFRNDDKEGDISEPLDKQDVLPDESDEGLMTL
jgi:hypothetical protein